MDLLRCALPPLADPTLAEAALRPFLADHACQALAAARARPATAGATLAAWFRRTRRLGSRDRRRVSKLVYGLVRHESLLGRVAGPEDQDRLPALSRLLAGDRFPELSSQGEDADLATALSLPLAVAVQWRAALGSAEACALAATLAGRAPMYLRVNLARGSREQAAAALAEEGVATTPVGPFGLRVEGRANLGGTQALREGRVEVQDRSSQALIEALAQAEELAGARVLDLCAGAGGKSLALAALGARVQAWDLRPTALAELGRRAARAGVTVHVAPPRGSYDLVLVDAPCSGTGRLMREPTLRWDLDPTRYLAVQAELLAQGAGHTRRGGQLAYATCSLLAAENDPPVPEGLALEQAVIRWPHRVEGDGFGWRLWRA